MGLVLVSGANGYVGGRLVPELIQRGYRVRAMVRARSLEYQERWPNAEVVLGDARDLDGLTKALRGVHTAYYLIHSLHLGPQTFESVDIRAAKNFRIAAEHAAIKRIIYLGGLGDNRSPLSAHLRSRINVALELANGSVPLTVLRAAIIIGSGSASYEIIQHLVKRATVLPIPHWAKTKCQPIAVRDVVKYLVGALETEQTVGKFYDIGGQDVLSYETMLRILSDLLQKRKLYIASPISSINLFAYLISLITPVPHPITHCLLESIVNEVVCQNNDIRNILPFPTLSFREALVRAMSREEQDLVYTRWSDAYPPAHELAIRLRELSPPPRYLKSYSLLSEKPGRSLYRSICRIGGQEGWFNTNWMWRLRGSIDRLLSGVGLLRGRRSRLTLRINDVIDFWRVEDMQNNRMLLLRAEMKLPGKAWLRFNIDPENGKQRLSVTAYYHTDSFFGKLYWYLLLPFHFIVFYDLIKQIDKKSD